MKLNQRFLAISVQFFPDELFNQIAQDYVANPNKVKRGEDNLITLHQSPKRQWCCCG